MIYNGHLLGLSQKRNRDMDIGKQYSGEKITIGERRAIVLSGLAVIPISLICGTLFILVWGIDPQLIDYYMQNLLPIILILNVGFLVGAIVHELLHGVTWALFAKDGFKSIKFGVMWKILSPYCHCKEPLKFRHFIAGALMPTMLLGILPTLIAIYIGNLILLVFGIMFIAAGGGDLLMIYSLRNEKPSSLIQDHPTEIGCIVYRLVEEA
jgi:hypothetical protein